MRPLLTAACFSLAISAAPVSAQSIEEQVINQLSTLGYSRFETGRTLLGRVRVIGLSGTHRREIVIHPTTGAVLFDERSRLARGDDDYDDDTPSVPQLQEEEGFEEDESDDDDDDDEDDEEDDDDEEDEDDEEDDDEEDDDEDDEDE